MTNLDIANPNTTSKVVPLTSASELMQPVNPVHRLIAVLERAIGDPSIPLDRIETMVALLKDAVLQAKEQAFNEAMRLTQAEIPAIQKTGINPQTKSRFAKLENVIAAVTPVITKHGFAVSFGTDSSPLEGHYRVVADLTHKSGLTRHYQADVPADLVGPKGTPNKNATQGFGSTMSYGRRYLLLLIFNIEITDEDTDAVTTQEERSFVSEEQIAEIRKQLRGSAPKANPANEEALCKALNIKALENIYADKFQNVLDLIAAKKKAAKK